MSIFEDYLIHGFYPRIYDKNVLPKDLYANYVRTYIERDVRLLKNIHDLTAFHTFLKLCAHRTGQLLNLSLLATDCGITHNTAKAWLSLLETSYIVFFCGRIIRILTSVWSKCRKCIFMTRGWLRIWPILKINSTFCTILSGGVV